MSSSILRDFEEGVNERRDPVRREWDLSTIMKKVAKMATLVGREPRENAGSCLLMEWKMAKNYIEVAKFEKVI